MPTRSVDEFMAIVDACDSTDKLFRVYRNEVERHGFQNVVFVRQLHTTIVEVPYLCAPEGALEVYLEQNLAEHDPMVRLVANRTPAFTWNEMERQCVTKAERDTLGICREIGCTGGYAMPFYGPHGVSDVFDITFREPRTVDPAIYKSLSMKTYATWLRYQELDSVTTAGAILRPDNQALAPSERPAKRMRHRDGHERITAEECRALVICDIAERRYKAALTELNDGLKLILGAEMLQRLLNRGLLVDVPDDDHMRFYYQPSPIAVAHLKRCAHAAPMRTKAWQLHVHASERPAEWW